MEFISPYSAPGILFPRNERSVNGAINPKLILAATCQVFAITNQQITSKTRQEHIAIARHFVCCLLFQNTFMTYKAIGEIIKRDGSTAWHSINAAKAIVKTKHKGYHNLMQAIETILKS